MIIIERYSIYKYSDYCFNILFFVINTVNYLLKLNYFSLKIEHDHRLNCFYEVIDNFPENLSQKYSILHFF
jgi:hypothetical protein